MPSSAVRSFSDPDDYVAAIRQGTVEVTVTGTGNFAAKLTKIDLHRLWMQRFSENLPRIYHVDGWGGRTIIVFRTQIGPSLLRRQGRERYHLRHGLVPDSGRGCRQSEHYERIAGWQKDRRSNFQGASRRL